MAKTKTATMEVELNKVEAAQALVRNAQSLVDETRAQVADLQGRIAAAHERIAAIDTTMLAAQQCVDALEQDMLAAQRAVLAARTSATIAKGAGREKEEAAAQALTQATAQLEGAQRQYEAARQEHQAQAPTLVEEKGRLSEQVILDETALHEAAQTLEAAQQAYQDAHTALGRTLFDDVAERVTALRQVEAEARAAQEEARENLHAAQAAIAGLLADWPTLREKAQKRYGPAPLPTQTEMFQQRLADYLTQLEYGLRSVQLPKRPEAFILDMLVVDQQLLRMCLNADRLNFQQQQHVQRIFETKRTYLQLWRDEIAKAKELPAWARRVEDEGEGEE